MSAGRAVQRARAILQLGLQAYVSYNTILTTTDAKWENVKAAALREKDAQVGYGPQVRVRRRRLRRSTRD
jgi:hypothetical protein